MADSIPRPSTHDPWQFTQSANSGGNHHNVRGRPDHARSMIRSNTANNAYPINCGRSENPMVPKKNARKPPSMATSALPQ